MPIRLKIPLWQLAPKQLQTILKVKDKPLPKAIVKPERKLGACWTSDRIARRKPVVMCEECWRKYRGWWVNAHYRADWGWPYVINCDGCSRIGIHGTLFLPEEGFYEVLSSAHGLNPKP
jgi:hypothetical protein